MKAGKQAIKGKNVGGRQGVLCFSQGELFTGCWSQPGGSGLLHLLCKDSNLSMINIIFSRKHRDFHFPPQISVPMKCPSFSRCFVFCFLTSSIFALFVLLIIFPRIPRARQFDANADTLPLHAKVTWVRDFV